MWDEQAYPHQEITESVIGAAIKVHRALEPGLLESAYEVCLADEMTRRGIRHQQQVPLPVVFEGRRFDCGYRMDFVVENAVILELKCVEAVLPIHEAQ
jgi:GxxExxY protein